MVSGPGTSSEVSVGLGMQEERKQKIIVNKNRLDKLDVIFIFPPKKVIAAYF
jgi:hypothetical protein